MNNYYVTLEAAWSVKDVESVEDAMSVAISEAGNKLNKSGLGYVEIDIGSTLCPACGQPFESVYIAADTALVGLIFGMKVFNAENEEHAVRIAKSSIGNVLTETPLEEIEVEEIPDEEVDEEEVEKGREA
ncbi:DUF555 domain-containing protein [Methanonatronarchaeum sp. AMET6-2]|uniref:DUF555 domain-containing protein n=1 Tax=Methanonatronarchaeum sp. AMET6-2 TaxID=2933293 RepID=UPI00120AC383|nr:DUF555 domain-containing protein [Methanonatronarchaeum sp. AMET6-2]RZN63490.1 MAG: DUF555 domain-containing protein [Methanonatronarchaeia archaeon]UOY09727.1 DUF555 domain-containing protein [Methanonatronarchaeum sp. AMET6-2]